MSDEVSRIRQITHRWDEEDTARDEREEQAKRAFLEQEANQLFAPVENYLTRLARVLHAADALLEIDPAWEHLGERKLHRVGKVLIGQSGQPLLLDFTVEGATIFYCNRAYRFTGGVEALIPVITSDVEQFITAQTEPARLRIARR